MSSSKRSPLKTPLTENVSSSSSAEGQKLSTFFAQKINNPKNTGYSQAAVANLLDQYFTCSNYSSMEEDERYIRIKSALAQDILAEILQDDELMQALKNADADISQVNTQSVPTPIFEVNKLLELLNKYRYTYTEQFLGQPTAPRFHRLTQAILNAEQIKEFSPYTDVMPYSSSSHLTGSMFHAESEKITVEILRPKSLRLRSIPDPKPLPFKTEAHRSLSGIPYQLSNGAEILAVLALWFQFNKNTPAPLAIFAPIIGVLYFFQYFSNRNFAELPAVANAVDDLHTKEELEESIRQSFKHSVSENGSIISQVSQLQNVIENSMEPRNSIESHCSTQRKINYSSELAPQPGASFVLEKTAEELAQERIMAERRFAVEDIVHNAVEDTPVYEVSSTDAQTNKRHINELLTKLIAEKAVSRMMNHDDAYSQILVNTRAFDSLTIKLVASIAAVMIFLGYLGMEFSAVIGFGTGLIEAIDMGFGKVIAIGMTNYYAEEFLRRGSFPPEKTEYAARFFSSIADYWVFSYTMATIGPMALSALRWNACMSFFKTMGINLGSSKLAIQAALLLACCSTGRVFYLYNILKKLAKELPTDRTEVFGNMKQQFLTNKRWSSGFGLMFSIMAGSATAYYGLNKVAALMITAILAGLSITPFWLGKTESENNNTLAYDAESQNGVIEPIDHSQVITYSQRIEHAKEMIATSFNWLMTVKGIQQACNFFQTFYFKDRAIMAGAGILSLLSGFLLESSALQTIGSVLSFFVLPTFFNNSGGIQFTFANTLFYAGALAGAFQELFLKLNAQANGNDVGETPEVIRVSNTSLLTWSLVTSISLAAGYMAGSSECKATQGKLDEQPPEESRSLISCAQTFYHWAGEQCSQINTQLKQMNNTKETEMSSSSNNNSWGFS